MSEGCCDDDEVKVSPVLVALLNGIRSAVDHALEYDGGFETTDDEAARKALTIVESLVSAARRELPVEEPDT